METMTRFYLRTPRRFPGPLIDGLRRSMAAGAGWVQRLYVLEAVPDDARRPPRLMLGAEVRVPRLTEERAAEVERDSAGADRRRCGRDWGRTT